MEVPWTISPILKCGPHYLHLCPNLILRGKIIPKIKGGGRVEEEVWAGDAHKKKLLGGKILGPIKNQNARKKFP